MDKNNKLIKNILEIKNDILKSNYSIDEKCLEIQDLNNINEKKIIKYKLLMENIILEYHKVCKDLHKPI